MDRKKQIFKYFKLMMQYDNKKIWYLLLLALVPSVLIAFVLSPYGAIDFLCNYSELYKIGFWQMFLVVFGINTRFYYLGIIGAVISPFVLSIIFGAVERHMRVGEFNLGFDRIRTRLNFNIITALKFLAVVFLIFAFFKFLQVLLFYLFARVLNMGWAFALSLIWYILMFALELVVMSSGILWVPTMLQTGLNSTRALGLALRQNKGYTLGTMVSFMIPELPMLILMIIDAEFNLHVHILLDALLITFTIVLYVIYMNSMFFDINGIEREDLKKVSIWKDKKKKA